MKYLFDPANYMLNDDSSIPNLLVQHLNIVLISMLIALAIALPLGLVIARYRFLYFPVITFTGLLYTIPAMALIGLLFAILPGKVALTTVTIIIPLVIYAQLALIRNIVAGIRGVDPLLLEVGRGMGMNGLQRLWRITLPLALPVIIAGIRLAAVTTIGIASLASLAGSSSLGSLIFDGIQNANYDQVLAGAILITLLALIVDLLLLGLQLALSRGRSRLALA